MPQLHFYVPHEVAEEVRRRAASRGLTVSAFVAEVVREQVAGGWPPGYFEDVVGKWEGEPLERPPQPRLEQRKRL